MKTYAYRTHPRNLKFQEKIFKSRLPRNWIKFFISADSAWFTEPFSVFLIAEKLRHKKLWRSISPEFNLLIVYSASHWTPLPEPYGPYLSIFVMKWSPHMPLLYGAPAEFLSIPNTIRWITSPSCSGTTSLLLFSFWSPNRFPFTSIASTTIPRWTEICSSGALLSLHKVASGHSKLAQSHTELLNSRSL